MLDYFKGLAIRDLANAIGHGGHAIVKVHLAGGDIDRLMLFMVQATASGKEDQRTGCKQSERAGSVAPKR